MRAFPILLGALALSACATARMHDQMALNEVALGCGMSYGELFQDAEEKRLLFAMKSNITQRQRSCVTEWARRNHLKAVFVRLDTPEG